MHAGRDAWIDLLWHGVCIFSCVTVTQFTLSPPGMRARMVYENQEGDQSARTVDVIRWSHGSNGYTYLRAWCHLRAEERTFRADRIKSWEVAETAETVAAAAGGRSAEARPRGAAVYAEPAAAPRAPAWTPAPVSAAPRPRLRGKFKQAFVGLVRLAAYAACAFIALLIVGGLFPAASASAPSFSWKPPAATFVTSRVARAAIVSPALPARTAPTHVPTPQDIRQKQFTARTHIADPRVFKLFESADSDRSGGLSIAEIEAFQSRLYRRFTYMNNDTALRPDQFLDAGGGDCDDWALTAAGMLRYWGFTSWLVIYGAGIGDAHAVCFLQVPRAPDGVGFIMLESPAEFADATLPAGYYIPIDYDHVGSLSNAVTPGWTMRDAWAPEKAYGQPM